MCGICGISGEIQNNGIMLSLLLIDNECRGRDATGYAYHHKEKDMLYWRKDGLKATEFVSSYLWQRYPVLKSNAIIGHTRAGTGGKASDNNNNHPFITEHLVLVHNGILHNDTELTHKHSLVRTAITDSEVIPLMMEKFGNVEGLEKIVGSYALAWLDNRKPNSLFLAHNDGSPLHIGYRNGTLLFSSDDKPLNKLGCRDIIEIAENKIFEFKDGKVISTIPFKGQSYWSRIKHYYSGFDYVYNRRTDTYDYFDRDSKDEYKDILTEEDFVQLSIQASNKKDFLYNEEVFRIANRFCKYNPKTYTYEEVSHLPAVMDKYGESENGAEYDDEEYYGDVARRFDYDY